MTTNSHSGAETSFPNLARNYHKLDTVEAIKLSFQNHLKYTLAKDEYSATDHDRYWALAMTVRDRLIEKWIQTSQTYYHQNVKRVYYLSMEYLIGRAMGNNVINMRLDRNVERAMADLGLDWDFLREVERDAGLGNGGLGRLAACFLDSMATMELPGYGYGVRYDYGIFRQAHPRRLPGRGAGQLAPKRHPVGNRAPRIQFPVQFGGHVVEEPTAAAVPRWVDDETVIGIPYDFPIAGYGNNTVNNLRLWTAKATEEFDLEFFNNGDYIKAYERKTLTENITKILYPNDRIEQGRELRFKQQYFFVSCSIQDIVRRFKVNNPDFHAFPDKVAIQLNDTHPALAVAELMRILLDGEKMEWDEAWDITTRTFGYTNHTLMPEALEKWPVRFFQEFLPRHLSIIYEINRRFLRQVMNKFPDDSGRVARMSLIEEGPEKQVRCASLSVVGSHKVNGVAKLHSELLKKHLFKDFHDLWPHKFIIDHQRHHPAPLAPQGQSRPGAPHHRENRRRLDHGPRRSSRGWSRSWTTRTSSQRLRAIKRENKLRLVELIKRENKVEVNPDTLFDVQVKRLHEYKRQILNVLHIIHRYAQLKDNPALDVVPRTCDLRRARPRRATRWPS